MSAVFSYAHAAGAPSSSNVAKSEIENGISNLSISDKEPEKVVQQTKKTDKTDKKEKKEKKASRSSSKEPESKPEPSKEDQEPKKVKLAPAPLPATNVWGSTPTVIPAKPSVEAIGVRESTPEATPVVAKAAQGKEKWVPFKASVVIASNKSTPKPQGKKKNKKKNFKDGEAKENKDLKKNVKKAGDARETELNGDASSANNVLTPENASNIKQSSELESESNELKADESQQKFARANGNGNNSFAGRQYRMHYNNQNKRYSGQAAQNGKVNGANGQLPYAPYNSRPFNGQNNRHHHSRPSYQQQSQYFIPQQPPFYAPIPYIPYPAAPAPFASVIPQQPQQISIPPQDSSMRDAMLQTLAKQIDYYFSTQNLVKDIFLRKHMNSDGFLPLSVLAGFYRVSGLSYGDYNLVIESLTQCGNLEYGIIEQEDQKIYKVRAKLDPTNWVLPADQRLEQGLDEQSPSLE
ncbi:hypothetical protein OGAPHI_004378 [Ogataea philodendri]|uniref:HTH La-type RNA-binding domain-containing protein n=1 Tax=Ogataea philodendri TaxID=1378263 RepID=A0A9P8P748_9ASCO|nr:uncharacterized protein OGAPHI_004378 [Ogataea philodendri]KAH3666189.1 hypothetical protein OGAPHI_004378 [Ogataea philodendri]